jgi:hypothetical protein
MILRFFVGVLSVSLLSLQAAIARDPAEEALLAQRIAVEFSKICIETEANVDKANARAANAGWRKSPRELAASFGSADQPHNAWEKDYRVSGIEQLGALDLVRVTLGINPTVDAKSCYFQLRSVEVAALLNSMTGIGLTSWRGRPESENESLSAWFFCIGQESEYGRGHFVDLLEVKERYSGILPGAMQIRVQFFNSKPYGGIQSGCPTSILYIHEFWEDLGLDLPDDPYSEIDSATVD